MNFFAQNLMGRLDFLCNRVFRQFGQQFNLLVENRPHTIGDMLLVCPVDGHTFFAIPMVAAGLLARTMVFVFVFLPEFRRKFFLQF